MSMSHLIFSIAISHMWKLRHEQSGWEAHPCLGWTSEPQDLLCKSVLCLHGWSIFPACWEQFCHRAKLGGAAAPQSPSSLAQVCHLGAPPAPSASTASPPRVGCGMHRLADITGISSESLKWNLRLKCFYCCPISKLTWTELVTKAEARQRLAFGTISSQTSFAVC